MASKVYQYKTEYDLNDGTMYVNTYNGGMVYTYPLVSIGENTFKINVGFVYNSNFKESFFKKIIMGNEKGWKLNIEELVIKYDDRFNLDGFIYSDYVYVDSMWNIHRFVQYKATGSLTEYYDESGTGLKLKVEPNKDIIMVDEENNERIFDKTTGKLIKVISSINYSLQKTIEYDNFQRVIKVYDSRKQNRYISFSYDEESNLTQVTTTINSCYYTLEYENNLTKINEQVGERIRPLIEISYNEFYLLSEITTPLTNDITKLEYDNDLLTNIITGKLKKELITETVPSENYLGENLYLGDGKYLTGESLKVVETKNVLTNENTIEKIYYDYHESYTDITNIKGVKYRYSFDITGRLLTILEVKDDNSFYTLNKETGWELDEGTIDLKINNKKAHIFQKENNKYKLVLKGPKLYETLLYLYNQIDEEGINIEKFYLSFYLMFNLPNAKNLILTLKTTSNNEVRKVIIADTSSYSWQKVMIPIPCLTNLIDTKIVLEIEKIDNEYPNLSNLYLSNPRIVKGGDSLILITNKEDSNDHTFKKIVPGTTLYYVENETEKEVTITKDFYFTENDILSTYRSIYNNLYNQTTETNNQFDLYYCNKTKVKQVSKVSLTSQANPNNNAFTFGFKKEEENDGNKYIPNYRIRNINLTRVKDTKRYEYVLENYVIIKPINIKSYKIETKTLVNLLSEDEINNILTDKYVTNTTTKRNDGLILSTKYVEKIYNIFGNLKRTIETTTSYTYDTYGNILKEENSSSDLDDVIIKDYEYMESNSYSYEYLKRLTENGSITEFEYTNDGKLSKVKTKINKVFEDGYVSNTIDSTNSTTKYLYDEFNKIISIEFYDKNNQLIGKNEIEYNDNGTIKKLTDGTNYYGYHYNLFGGLAEVYHNKNLLERYTTFDNNIYRKYTTYTYQNNQENKIQETYDTLDRITSIEYNSENEDVLFEYEDDETYSPSLQRIKKINDNINKINYTYNYEDTNIDGTTTTLNIETPKLNYSIETKPNNTITYSIGNEKIKQEISSDDLINNLPTKSYTYVNNSNNEFEKLVYYSYDYEYDNLGRPTQKQGLVDEYSQATIQTTKNISYYPNTMYPKEIKYTTLSKLKETGNKQQAEITYKNSYIDGRITKVVEEETRFKENPKNASSQNTLTEKTTKTKTFNYDDFGRLIEETTEDGSTIKYIYGTGIKQIERTKNNKTSTEIYEYTTGKLTQITKDGIIIKVDSDNYGNIIKIGNKEIKYNNQNKVRCILENKNTYEYEYNYQGIRTKKIINNEEEINYYLNGNKIIGERKINKTTGNIIEELRYYYDIGGVCGIEYKKDNETYYYNLIKDTLGNISKVMYRGKVIGEYSYDAWGNVSTIIHEDTNPNEVDRKIVGINPYRYKGYYIDIETGLYYCNARYYDPKIYQWIQRDSIEYLDNESLDGLNLYCYCYNNPIMYVDNFGNLPVQVDVITSIIGYSADLYSFILKESLKSMPELSMSIAKKMARKARHIQSARGYIKTRHSNIVNTKNLRNNVQKFSKYFGKVVLVADILWSVGENYFSGDPNWVSDSVVDVGITIGIYALGSIPYVGWALAIGATILTKVFDDEIEEFKDWFAKKWNDFWSLSRAS